MALPRPFLELTVAEWLDALAGADASPGAGSALAFAVAEAAAVVAMVARVSKDSWDAAGGVAAQAQLLRARAAPLAQVDADAYRRALDARREAADLRPDQRDFEIGRAFAAAAEPLLEIARTAADVAELAAELAAHGDGSVRLDAAAAAGLAAAAARASVAFVTANLTAIDGDPRVAEVERAAEAAETAAARAARAARE